jgi:signal peptidase II
VRFSFIALLVVVADQLTKLWITREMFRGESRRVLGDFLKLTYVQNEGAAFGLSFGGRWSFVVVTILVAVFILVYYSRSERTTMSRLALALILGGALGNLLDRVRIGEVVDFVHVSVNRLSWPVFNVADIAITAGVALLAFHLFRREEPQERPPEIAEDAISASDARRDEEGEDDASRGPDPITS